MCVDSEMMHGVHLIVGLFVLSCLASSYFFGWLSIAVCLAGLFVVAMILDAFDGGKGGQL